MKIIQTITLAKCDDGQIREISVTFNHWAANIIDKPLAALRWGDDFHPVSVAAVLENTAEPNAILQVVSDYFKVPPKQVMSKYRQRELVIVRQMTVYFLKVKTMLSLADIGRFMGRDHSTAIWSFKVINSLLFSDEVVRAHYAQLESLLREYPDVNPKPSHKKRKPVVRLGIANSFKIAK